VWPCSMYALERTTEGLKSPSGSCVSYSNILSLTMGILYHHNLLLVNQLSDD
jgi:hypothetical protein